MDGKLVIDDELLDFEELVKTMEQDDLTHKGGAWSEVWFSGMRGELETLCYFLPTWGLHYTLKPHCAEGWDDTKSEEENLAALGDNIGTYGASSSRNQFLSRILESVPYPEGYPERGFIVGNRGAGFARIQESLSRQGMRSAHLKSGSSRFCLTMWKGDAAEMGAAVQRAVCLRKGFG